MTVQKEPSIYLDTTIFSYLFDERPSIKNFVEVTQNWWDTQRASYNLYTSFEVLAELNMGNYPKKNEIIHTAETIDILAMQDEIIQTAEIYIDNFIMPKNVQGDAIHLAYASFYKLSFLLTWNCNHLANANKKQHIQIINTKLGLYTPEIITPLQLFKED